MFDHVKFGVSDYAASKAFFVKALEPLGVAVVSEGPPTYGVELSPQGKASLCLYQTEEKPAHLHLAFTAENRQQVDAFYRAALEAGGRDNGAPGPRPNCHANYYAAFVIGPDGTTSKWFATNPRPNPSIERTRETRPHLMSNVERPVFGGLPGVSSARFTSTSAVR
jgi:catechol 2,3-dioxygenase-like lactoylglutathione lyase family enzyme